MSTRQTRNRQVITAANNTVPNEQSSIASSTIQLQSWKQVNNHKRKRHSFTFVFQEMLLENSLTENNFYKKQRNELKKNCKKETWVFKSLDDDLSRVPTRSRSRTALIDQFFPKTPTRVDLEEDDATPNLRRVLFEDLLDNPTKSRKTVSLEANRPLE